MPLPGIRRGWDRSNGTIDILEFLELNRGIFHRIKPKHLLLTSQLLQAARHGYISFSLRLWQHFVHVLSSKGYFAGITFVVPLSATDVTLLINFPAAAIQAPLCNATSTTMPTVINGLVSTVQTAVE